MEQHHTRAPNLLGSTRYIIVLSTHLVLEMASVESVRNIIVPEHHTWQSVQDIIGPEQPAS